MISEEHCTANDSTLVWHINLQDKIIFPSKFRHKIVRWTAYSIRRFTINSHRRTHQSEFGNLPYLLYRFTQHCPSLTSLTLRQLAMVSGRDDRTQLVHSCQWSEWLCRPDRPSLPYRVTAGLINGCGSTPPVPMAMGRMIVSMTGRRCRWRITGCRGSQTDCRWRTGRWRICRCGGPIRSNRRPDYSTAARESICPRISAG